MNLGEFQTRHNLLIEKNKYIDIRYIISQRIQRIGSHASNLYPQHQPIFPIAIDIATRSKKGCNV